MWHSFRGQEIIFQSWPNQQVWFNYWQQSEPSSSWTCGQRGIIDIYKITNILEGFMAQIELGPWLAIMFTIASASQPRHLPACMALSWQFCLRELCHKKKKNLFALITFMQAVFEQFDLFCYTWHFHCQHWELPSLTNSIHSCSKHFFESWKSIQLFHLASLYILKAWHSILEMKNTEKWQDNFWLPPHWSSSPLEMAHSQIFQQFSVLEEGIRYMARNRYS